MNELNNEKWYTIEELAKLTGYSVDSLKKGDNPLVKLSIDPKVDIKMGGYRNTQKFYSQNVLKALKEYQIKNSIPNATKNKQTALTGNMSYIGNIAVNSLLDNPEALLTLINASAKKLLTLQKENEAQKQQINELQPKADVYNRISESEGLFTINQTAKALQLSYGHITLFQRLVLNKIVMDNAYHTPYQQYINNGYFVVKTKIIPKINKSITVTLVTPKGLIWLAKQLETTIDKNVQADA